MRSTPATAAAWIVAGMLGPALPRAAEAQLAVPCEAYWNADAVFVGRIETVTRVGSNRRVSFAVVEAHRGVSSSSIDVTAQLSNRDSCVSLKAGDEYFVYATRSRSAGTSGLMTNRCADVRRIDDAAADESYARAVRDGTAPAGFISGSVSVIARSLAGKPLGIVAVPPPITVAVSHDDETDTIVTERGEFRVASRGAGAYRVAVNVPQELYSDVPVTIVTLRDPRSCAKVGVALHDNGQLSGRVIDAGNRPIAGLTIELGPAGPGPGRRTVTDRSGRYTLTRLPRGRFVLSVPAGPPPATGDRPPRVFHPGVETIAAAGRVTVGSGERVTLADFRMPARQKHLSISGVVFGADGTAAEGALVYLKGVGADDRIVSEPVITDFMGAFVIAARAGAEYRLFAERPRAVGGSSRVDSSDPVTVTAGDGVKPMRLTLTRRY